MTVQPLKLQLAKLGMLCVIVGLASGLAACGVRGKLTAEPKPANSAAPVGIHTTPTANVLVGSDGKTVLIPTTPTK